MQLPPNLPAELEDLRKISDPNELFTQLVQNTQKLILFFEAVSDDDVWVQRNPDFLEKIIAWLSQQCFQNRLDDETARRAAHNIHTHFSSFRTLIPMTLTLIVDNQKYPINPLLFGTTSPLFKDLILEECHAKNKMTMPLNNVSAQSIKSIIEFANEGTLENLWKQSRDEILSVLRQANYWNIVALSKLCQESMHRYIDKERVIPTLIEAQRERWPILKDSCIDFFNTLGYGLELRKRGPDDLAVEFFNFRLLTMEIFQQISAVVTHLICRGDLCAEREFMEVMRMCPWLRSVDVSDSTQFGEWFSTIPINVEELILARCAWLNTGTLSSMVSWCPQVRRWDLTSAIQLNLNSWVELQRVGGLVGLILTGCHPLQDQDLLLILRSCIGLKELSVQGCRNLTETGLRAIARSNLRLGKLNLARTKLSEIVFVDIVAHVYSLEEVDITHCPITPSIIKKVSLGHPKLRIISGN